MNEDPVKVMRVIARLNVGGPALHCLLLSKKLEQYGFSTVLVAGQMAEGEESYEKLFEHRPDIGDVEVTRLRRLTRLPSIMGDLQSLLELVSLMRRERPAVVHTHTAKAGVLGRIAAFLTGVPVVIHTFHGHVLHGYFSKFISTLITYLERSLALGSSAIVTLSPALKKELSGRFKIARPGRFHIIPLGRDLEPFYECKRHHGELRNELGLTEDTPLVGCVGRLVPIKDHRTLLEAFRVMNNKEAQLVIVGDGELKEDLQIRVRTLSLEQRVHFVGWRSDLPRIYCDLDLLALSSRNEGTPLSIIESFAASCPVVATQVGGVKDMFHDHKELADNITQCAEGYLVPSASVKAFAAALDSMIERSDYRLQCAARGRQSAAYYSDENLAERMAGLYNTLLVRPQ